jgi:hypothetical protein
MISSNRRTPILLLLVFASGCGARSERDVSVCRNAWRELSIPGEFRDFRAGAAVWIGGRLVLLRAESDLVPKAGPKGVVFEPPGQFAAISEEGAPSFVLLEATIAAGTNLLVFSDRGFEMGRYDTVSDTWAPLPPVGLDYSRMSALVPLPDEGALVGVQVDSDDASRTQYFTYEAIDDAWREVSSPPEEPLYGWNGVWTGADVVVGGITLRGNEEAWLGARYSPSTNTWSTLPAPGGSSTIAWLPEAWTGSEVIFHGLDLAAPEAPGVLARYNPDGDTWELASNAGSPMGSPENVVAAGRRVVFWNAIHGATPEELERDSGVYDPETDEWDGVPTRCGPETRLGQLLTWTGDELVVWGGSCPNEPREQCAERAWSLSRDALYREFADDPPSCSCPAPFGAE